MMKTVIFVCKLQLKPSLSYTSWLTWYWAVNNPASHTLSVFSLQSLLWFLCVVFFFFYKRYNFSFNVKWNYVFKSQHFSLDVILFIIVSGQTRSSPCYTSYSRINHFNTVFNKLSPDFLFLRGLYQIWVHTLVHV